MLPPASFLVGSISIAEGRLTKFSLWLSKVRASTCSVSFHTVECLRPFSFFVSSLFILSSITFVAFLYAVVTTLSRRWLYQSFANLYLLKVLSAGVNVLIYILLFLSLRLIVVGNYFLLYQGLLYVPDQSCPFRMVVDISFEVGIYYVLFRILRNLLFVYRHSHFSSRCLSHCCWFCSCWLSCFNFSQLIAQFSPLTGVCNFFLRVL